MPSVWEPSKPDYEYTDEEVIQTPVYQAIMINASVVNVEGEQVPVPQDMLIEKARELIAEIWAMMLRDKWVLQNRAKWAAETDES
jgi:hypothetical protein